MGQNLTPNRYLEAKDFEINLMKILALPKIIRNKYQISLYDIQLYQISLVFEKL